MHAQALGGMSSGVRMGENWGVRGRAATRAPKRVCQLPISSALASPVHRGATRPACGFTDECRRTYLVRQRALLAGFKVIETQLTACIGDAKLDAKQREPQGRAPRAVWASERKERLLLPVLPKRHCTVGATGEICNAGSTQERHVGAISDSANVSTRRADPLDPFPQETWIITADHAQNGIDGCASNAVTATCRLSS